MGNKATEVAFRAAVFPLNFSWAVSNFSVQPAVRKCKMKVGVGDIRLTGLAGDWLLRWTGPRVTLNATETWSFNGIITHSFSSKSNVTAIPVINQQLMGKTAPMRLLMRLLTKQRQYWRKGHLAPYIYIHFYTCSNFFFCFPDSLLWCSSTIQTTLWKLQSTYNKAVVL